MLVVDLVVITLVSVNRETAKKGHEDFCGAAACSLRQGGTNELLSYLQHEGLPSYHSSSLR